jgi:hypothetical protein
MRFCIVVADQPSQLFQVVPDSICREICLDVVSCGRWLDSIQPVPVCFLWFPADISLLFRSDTSLLVSVSVVPDRNKRLFFVLMALLYFPLNIDAFAESINNIESRRQISSFDKCVLAPPFFCSASYSI